MMSYAESLGESGRRRGRCYAYAATLTGCVSEVMLDSSAIIILYMAMLGGGDMLQMLVNCFSGLSSMLLLIPCVVVIARIGLKNAVHYACLTGCAGYLLMACSPWFGSYRIVAAVSGCMLYCLQRALYGAAWYPLLDAFLRPEDRGRFFGLMRFMYVSISGILFFLVGMVMGKEPPQWLMQMVIAIAGLASLGRSFCVSRFPEDPGAVRETPNLRRALGVSIRNGPLTAYAVYVCLLTMAMTSLVPLTYIYLKNYVGMAAGTVQMISTAGLCGSVTGFFFYGFLLKCIGMKKLEFLVHFSYIILPFLLFIVGKDTPGFSIFITVMLFVLCFVGSLFMCNNSGELLSLARPGNKAMATAFIQTYGSMGGFIGRSAASLVLGATMLAPVWELGGMEISRYQSIFLVCSCMAAVMLALVPTLPAVVPKHRDYYEPMR